MGHFILFMLCFLTCTAGFGQNNGQSPEEQLTDVLHHAANGADVSNSYLNDLSRDTLRGFYIPKDLGECFVQLDSLLQPQDRANLKAQKDRNDMILYHHGLGTFLRNNWGLWSGSRLQHYFFRRGISHPDHMSATILEYYHDWLKGETETWRKWEMKHPVVKKK